jgi:Fe-S cluster assembly ATPase SufC
MVSGRYLVKGANGRVKSTLFLEIKGEKENIFYLPAKFENPHFDAQGSTGQNKLNELKWLSENSTGYSAILLDEWDANLDPDATIIANQLLNDISKNIVVFEIRHKI